jgi:hypothetical protein
MMIAPHIDYHNWQCASNYKNGEDRWVMGSLGYSEFLYRFWLSGTSLLTYCELVHYD